MRGDTIQIYCIIFEIISDREVKVKTTEQMLLNGRFTQVLNPLTPELNPSAQRCLTRFFTGDFAS
jgi:hypothetical protein